MIIGTGLIAHAFAPYGDALADACIYAAGVSNSACTDTREFERERLRLEAALVQTPVESLFAYFSTCSIGDPDAQASAYVRHKLAMEARVRGRDRHLILRLPQLAGATPNPHTLLNYLHARIARSERFTVWRGASRNIIDVDCAARIVVDLIVVERISGETINVASDRSTGVLDIVRAMETATGHRAIFDIMERGAGYVIDTNRIQASLRRCGLSFSGDYLQRTLSKYYAPHARIVS